MRAKEFIVERRDRMLQYIKQILPTYPDYVIKDLVYNIARGKWPKKYSKFDENSIIDMLTYIGLEADTPWKLEKLTFNIDMFEEESKRMLMRDIQEQSKQDVSEGTDNKPTIGINIRNDGDIHYADLIVDGKKKYESRMTNSLKPYIGKTVGIVRTGNGPATAIGQVTIGEPIIVDEEEFNKLRNQHLVSKGSKFDIEPNGTKYLYPMINPIRWDDEKPISHKGIVSRKIQENEYDTRTDDERHDVQAKLAKQQGGVRNEPVILVAQPDGKYKLIEGWHRTAQHFVLHPNGYVGPAWVAYPNYINEDMSRRAFGLGALGALAGVGAQAKTQKPLPVTGYYQVSALPGQTIYSIARSTMTEPQDIMKLNGFNNKTRLEKGQMVKIPEYGKNPEHPLKAQQANAQTTQKLEPLSNKPLPHVDPVKAQQTPAQSKFNEPQSNKPFEELPLKKSWFGNRITVPWENINNYLKTKYKLDSNARKGLLVNIDRESGFQPNAYNPDDRGGPSGGLLQWHDKASDPKQRRFTNMTKAVPDWQTNWKGQIDYALTEPASREWISFNHEWANAEEAACTWVADFEKPADQKGEFRRRCALLPKFKTA